MAFSNKTKDKKSNNKTVNQYEDHNKNRHVKDYGKKYKNDIRKAYDVGYSLGWDAAYEIPKRFGAKIAAAFGYRKGIKYRYKADKYLKQYNRKGNKI